LRFRRSEGVCRVVLGFPKILRARTWEINGKPTTTLHSRRSEPWCPLEGCSGMLPIGGGAGRAAAAPERPAMGSKTGAPTGR
jgi:hypothetical protein